MSGSVLSFRSWQLVIYASKEDVTMTLWVSPEYFQDSGLKSGSLWFEKYDDHARPCECRALIGCQTSLYGSGFIDNSPHSWLRQGN
jgi:hypothetical protein